MRFYILLFLLQLLLASCAVKVPGEYIQIEEKPTIYPDFTDITIPSNIAPLNFKIVDKGDKIIAKFTSNQETFITSGEIISTSLNKWRKLLGAGNTISVEIYVKKGDTWNRFQPFCFNVAKDIDPFISYRLIPPSYESYEILTLNQRDLTSFKEKVIYSNALLQKEELGQCVNCHHYKNYTTSNMQFHCRQFLGGTVLVVENEIKKIDLKTDSTLSAGVYPAWHPTHDYIAYSINKTKQSLHTLDPNKVEVVDQESDLILYDIKNNTVSFIENDPDQFECFPAWSPDGRTLYYVSAYYKYGFGPDRLNHIIMNYKNFHYDLYSKSFDPENGHWGEPVKLIDAAAINKSITLPRVSPDGKYLMFTMGEYGVFHIWHQDADLYLMNLSDGSYRELTEINSDNVESYHSWSSNGRWIVFSTRRNDGNYTRLYLSYMGDDGFFSKPFPIPQKDPNFHDLFLLSYNIPEFMSEAVTITPHQFAGAIKKNEVTKAIFKSN